MRSTLVHVGMWASGQVGGGFDELAMRSTLVHVGMWASGSFLFLLSSFKLIYFAHES